MEGDKTVRVEMGGVAVVERLLLTPAPQLQLMEYTHLGAVVEAHRPKHEVMEIGASGPQPRFRGPATNAMRPSGEQ